MSCSLVVQTAFIGDVVLTTPLIAHLARHGPVDVVTTPAAAGVLANHPAIRRVIAWDKKRDRGPAALLRLAREVRATSRDATAYCAQGSVRTALLARLAGYRHRVGFTTSAARWLYTRRVKYAEGQHHAERLLRLGVGDEAGIGADDVRPRLHPGPTEREAVDALLDASTDARPMVALAPGSIWGTKQWPGYPELATILAADFRIVVVGGPGDQALASRIVDAVPGQALDATGRLSLLASAELIGRCGLLVTNDSAPQHLASAMGTPTVTVYGPTVPSFGFGPLAPGSVTVGHEGLPCRPCDHHGPAVCPLGHFRCMLELPVGRVSAAAHAILGTRHA
jgi:heptosyltransferase-2